MQFQGACQGQEAVAEEDKHYYIIKPWALTGFGHVGSLYQSHSSVVKVPPSKGSAVEASGHLEAAAHGTG